MEERVENGKKYFIYEGWSDEEIERTGFCMMEENAIAGLYPFRLIRQNEEKYFRYEAGDGMSLEQWLDRTHDKKEVLTLIENLVDISEEIEAYLLDERRLCTETAYLTVFGGRCHMAYIPLADYDGGGLSGLIRQITERVHYAMDEDFTYLFDLQNAFSRGDIKDADALKGWIRMQREGGQEQSAVINENRQKRENSLKSEKIPKCESSLQQENILPPQAKPVVKENRTKKKEAAEKKKKGFFFGSKKKDTEKEKSVQEEESFALREEQAEPKKKIYFQEEEPESDTILMQDIEPYLLIRCSDRREYLLEYDSYLVGSDQTADICISDNLSVSRKHARCFKERQLFYIEDLNSTNGTFLKGERITPGKRYPLYDGLRIRFSNEEFEVMKRRY